MLLVVMVALGRLTTRAVAAWLAGRASLKRIPVWVLSVVATLTAATAAAVVPTALFLALARR